MSMSQRQGTPLTDADATPNGPGAAAILAAGIGCAAVGILAFAGDASPGIGGALNFYNPTGTLSGVTTVAIVLWLVVWFVLGNAWRRRTVSLLAVNTVSFALLIVGFLLTFPPFMDLLQGK
jgi:hypothetical protein